MTTCISKQGELAIVTGTIKGPRLEILHLGGNQVGLAIFEAGDDYRGDVTLHSRDLVDALIQLGIFRTIQPDLAEAIASVWSEDNWLFNDPLIGQAQIEGFTAAVCQRLKRKRAIEEVHTCQT